VERDRVAEAVEDRISQSIRALREGNGMPRAVRERAHRGVIGVHAVATGAALVAEDIDERLAKRDGLLATKLVEEDAELRDRGDKHIARAVFRGQGASGLGGDLRELSGRARRIEGVEDDGDVSASRSARKDRADGIGSANRLRPAQLDARVEALLDVSRPSDVVSGAVGDAARAGGGGEEHRRGKSDGEGAAASQEKGE